MAGRRAGTPPIIEIRGLRARTLAGWRDNLLGPLALGFAALSMFLSRNRTEAFVFVSIASIASVAIFLWKWARGRIQLYANRLVMTSWNDSFPVRSVVIPFEDITSVRFTGSTFSAARHAPGKHRRSFRLSIAAPVAEELFDQLVEALELLDAPRFQVEEMGQGRATIRRIAADSE
jgi:hypothetical protein